MSFKQHIKEVYRVLNSKRGTYSIYAAQNERNLPLPEELFTQFRKSITQEDILKYPDLTNLKKKLHRHLNIEEEQLLITPGSDLAIKTVFEAFDLKGKNVVTTDYHFPMYGVYAQLNECELRTVPYKAIKFQVEDLLEKVDKSTAFIIIANPNSPLGDSYSIENIKLLLDTGIQVVIDEAYIELSHTQSCLKLIPEYKNLTVLRTFSKGYGAAGCRVGYLVSSLENMEYYSKLRFMYEVSSVSAKYCEFILDNFKYFKKYTDQLMKEKELLWVNLLGVEHPAFNTDSSWIYIKKTPQSDNMVEQLNIDIRTVRLSMYGSTEWYKFNYDLTIDSDEIVRYLKN